MAAAPFLRRGVGAPRRVLTLALGLGLAGAAFAAPGVGGDCRGRSRPLGAVRIDGRVFEADAAPPAPVAGAGVTVIHLTCAGAPGSTTVIADAAGRFEVAIDLHSLDAVVFEAVADGFAAAATSLGAVAIERGAAPEIGLLRRDGVPHRLTGHALAGGLCPAAPAGVEVVLEPPGLRTHVDERGDFAFDAVADGDYVVWADAPLVRAPPARAVRIAGADVALDLCASSCQVRPLVRPAAVRPGGAIALQGQCYEIHSGAAGDVYLDDRYLASVRGETGGDYDLGVRVPADVAPGAHVLRVVGAGRVIGAAPLTVSPDAPDGPGDGPAAPVELAATQQGPLDPVGLTDGGGVLYFAAAAPHAGRELWRSDGTAAGTVAVADLVPGAAGSAPQALTAWDGGLAFVATAGATGAELWRSDGTAAGTVRLADAIPGFDWRQPSELASAGGRLYFATVPAAAWQTDGTPAGTLPLAGIEPDPIAGGPVVRSIVATPDLVLVTLYAPTECCEVFRVLTGDPIQARPLFFFDGPPQGDRDLQPADFTPFAGAVYFRSGGDLHGTDGLETWTVWDPWTSGDPGAGAGPIAATGDALYFAVAGGGSGGLWRSAGRDAGAVQVRPFAGDAYGNPQIESLAAVGDTLFFPADDGLHGVELWRSDGTAAGTVLVRDLLPGPAGARPTNLLAVDGMLLFSATGARGTAELWVSDGSVAGTVRLQELPGIAPSPFVASGASVFFTLAAAPAGHTLWALPRAAVRPTAAPPCAGDCDGDRTVSVAELVRGVGMALGTLACDDCAPAFCAARCAPGPVGCALSVECLVRAVRNVLDGCAVDACRDAADCDDGNPCSADRCAENGCASSCVCV